MRTLLCLAAALGLGATTLAYGQEYGYDPRYGGDNVHYAYGEVLDVQPIYATSRYPSSQQVCWDEPVEYYHRGRPDSAGGAIAGAIIGGIVGNQFGSGHGRRAATAAGAVLGGAVGYDASRRGGYVSHGYQQRCSVERGWERAEEVVGYDVTYRYRGEIYHTRTDYHPGDSIQVRVAVDPVR